jgi:hypothetical protein
MKERVGLVVSTDEWEPSVRELRTARWEKGALIGDTREDVHARGSGIVFVEKAEYDRYLEARAIVRLFEEGTRNQAVREVLASEEYGDFDDGMPDEHGMSANDFMSEAERFPSGRRY